MNPSVVEKRLEQALRGATSHGPVSEAVIASAETELAVRFPESFRVFLRCYGASFGKGLELSGLPVSDRVSSDRMPQWSDLLVETRRARKNLNAPLPRNLLPISHDGGEYEYLLDLAAIGSDGECPVVVLGPGREFEVVASSFIEFVERTCHGEAP